MYTFYPIVSSGRKIVEILRRNPSKDPEKYTEEDLEHMRKVASYNKRHLAQEDKLKQSKSPEELEQTKSTKSLRVGRLLFLCLPPFSD